MDRSQMLSQKVEKEVRQLIGDLQMQIVVLRSMIEMQSGTEQQPHPQPAPPPPQPHPDHPKPDHKEPEHPQPEQAARKANGRLPHEANGAIR